MRPASSAGSPPRWSTVELLGGASEVVIEHQGELYRLRRTSKGRLILTK
jgi:hemin uptake protein HemP